MPRSPDGNYALPNPPVESGEVVSSTWANSTMSDLAQALTESLSRDGEGGMNVPLTFGDGTKGSPGISWESETTTGLYRAATGDMRVSVLGTDVFRWNAGRAQLWDGSAWVDVLITTDPNVVPVGVNQGDLLSWDVTGGEYVVGSAMAAKVTYDPTGNIVLSATDVQAALDETDIQLAAAATHISDTSIHWDDAPVDGTTYNRRDGAWVESISGVSDHSALNGLAVGDDHPQYLLKTDAALQYLGITDKAVDSTLWDGYTIEVTATPGTDPNTIYFVPVV